MTQNALRDLILLRGLPGSGKSTFALVLSENGRFPIFSVDDYFTDPQTGRYQFIHTENHKAYAQCEAEVANSMMRGMERIVVHNVFSMEWEMAPFFKLAEANGYRVFVMTMENYHQGSNEHGIPEEQMEKMRSKFKVRL